MNYDKLLDAARTAQNEAYCPYSNYAVGVALKTDTGIYTGANIETANYSNTLHGEETALAQAHMTGATQYKALFLVTPDNDPIPPCGSCRQTLAEFCPDDMPIITTDGTNFITWTLAELLPGQMDSDTVIDQ